MLPSFAHRLQRNGLGMQATED